MHGFKKMKNRMFGKRTHIFILLSVMAILTAMTSSCVPEWEHEMIPGISSPVSGSASDREINTDTRKVLLLYSAGFNSIGSYLKEDIEDLCRGWVPRQRRADDVILVYSHLPSARGQYTANTSPVLFRIYADQYGEVVRDTLEVYSPDTISSSAEQFHDVLSYVKETFPAKGYGLIFSSHATGYLPAGFYSKPDSYTFSGAAMRRQGLHGHGIPSPVPYIEPEQDPDLPAVKSIGQDVVDKLSYEMDIRDFAEAIPMKLDYILFDACLMGGIEVAYELADKCDLIGFSQAEVLAEGFNYTTLASHLLGNRPSSDPYSVCEDYFTQYDIQSGVYRSATISMVDCNRLEPVAEICRTLFERYALQLQTMDPHNVQRFYRSSRHWFYDLQSILEKAGITDPEKEALLDALEGCILYKGATPSFMNEFHIDTFSGFSMYLPSHGHPELDKYYRTLRWNIATGLVK